MVDLPQSRDRTPDQGRSRLFLIGLATLGGLVVVVLGYAFFRQWAPLARFDVVLEVDDASVIDKELQLVQTRLNHALQQAGMGCSVGATLRGTIELRGADAQLEYVPLLLEDLPRRWKVVATASGRMEVAMTSPEREGLIEKAVTETIAELPRRLASLGAMNVSVNRANENKNQVRLAFFGAPGNAFLEMLEDPAVLEFKEVSFPPGVDPAAWRPEFELRELLAQFGGELPPDTELFVQRIDRPAGGQLGLLWPLKRVSVVVGNDLVDARQTWDEWGEAAISFELNEEAGRRLEAATRRNLGRPMAIVLVYPDRTEVVSAPAIEGTISTMGIIRGSFTVTDAEQLAMKLYWGALPARLRVVEGLEPE